MFNSAGQSVCRPFEFGQRHLIKFFLGIHLLQQVHSFLAGEGQLLFMTLDLDDGFNHGLFFLMEAELCLLKGFHFFPVLPDNLLVSLDQEAEILTKGKKLRQLAGGKNNIHHAEFSHPVKGIKPIFDMGLCLFLGLFCLGDLVLLGSHDLLMPVQFIIEKIELVAFISDASIQAVQFSQK